ncbi:MAG: ABC transporter substrate-binding protein [Geminicoccaceae bacterium]|nr:MAG: ABC transporter substrate-binding protein [Geminicoccaceae bacterium]
MRFHRRHVIKTGAAAGALLGMGMPRLARAQDAGTIRAVMHGDLRVFDPIWTTANITAYHGAMIYDTLFGLDGNFDVRPQMVQDYGVSEDGLTWSFRLRDGLGFSDGTPVTTADVIPSIRRWAARDGAGQHMMRRVRDIVAKDERVFEIQLTEPYGLVIDSLAKTSTPLCYIMRRQEAETDPNEQITTFIGSGPFTFNQDLTQPGNRYVYDKNPNYVPRDDAPSGMAGAKIVKVDRVIWENIDDAQTAMAALQTGEIDFMETPPIDFLPMLEADPNLTVQVLNTLGNVGWLRLNFLHPPFDRVEARQAMMHLLNQEDFLRATFGNPQYFRTCGSYLTCGTPMESDVNMDWFTQGPNPERARELFAAAGYDGRPVTILQATNIPFMDNSAQIVAQKLRSIGINVELAASDWGGVVTRRAVQAPPAEGGWNIFITWGGGNSVASPINLSGHAATGTDGWFGWPSDELHEQLRDEWAAAPTLEARQEVSRRMQENAWNFVPHLYLGQWVAPVAHSARLSGILAIPEIVPFWNIEKSA